MKPPSAKGKATQADPPAFNVASRVLLALAHPTMERSRAGRAMSDAAQDLPGVKVHDLYEAYPDFVVDVPAEQAKLKKHDVIALQFPVQWYAPPALVKEWLDQVWLKGFAYGENGGLLRGKRMFVAVTTGHSAEGYHRRGQDRFTVDEFLRPLEQTAVFCGLTWETPFVVHGAIAKSHDALEDEARRYRERLISLVQAKPAVETP